MSMSVLLTTHLVVAFLLGLCALIFSGNSGGRRVVNAVAGLQLLIGVALAAYMGMNHIPLPAMIYAHIAAALLIMACYGFAMREGKRAGGGTRSLVLSLLGLILVVLNILGGMMMARGPVVAGDNLTVYYAKLDGTQLGTWTVSLRAPQPGETTAEHAHNVAVYAAVQSIAGPSSDIPAIHFPIGTHVLNVNVSGSTATVDLSKDVGSATGGSLQENGEFKGLVYTLTELPSINAVQITIEGRKVETLPGGHLELETPLRRSDW
jgi:hypothetical protein